MLPNHSSHSSPSKALFDPKFSNWWIVQISYMVNIPQNKNHMHPIKSVFQWFYPQLHHCTFSRSRVGTWTPFWPVPRVLPRVSIHHHDIPSWGILDEQAGGNRLGEHLATLFSACVLWQKGLCLPTILISIFLRVFTVVVLTHDYLPRQWWSHFNIIPTKLYIYLCHFYSQS